MRYLKSRLTPSIFFLIFCTIIVSVDASTKKYTRDKEVTDYALTGVWYKVREQVLREDIKGLDSSVDPYEWIRFDSKNGYSSFKSSTCTQYAAQEINEILGQFPATVKYTLQERREGIQYLLLKWLDIKNYQEVYTIGIIQKDVPKMGIKKGDLGMGLVIDKKPPVIVKVFRKLEGAEKTNCMTAQYQLVGYQESMRNK